MKVYRYMSLDEFTKLTSGIELHNNKKHNVENDTDSIGFCFLPEETTFVASNFGEDPVEVSFSPMSCYQFLYGIVSDDAILVEFEALQDFSVSKGTYADPIYQEWGNIIIIDELCTRSYSRDTCKPLRYCYAGEWQWYSLNLEN